MKLEQRKHMLTLVIHGLLVVNKQLTFREPVSIKNDKLSVWVVLHDECRRSFDLLQWNNTSSAYIGESTVEPPGTCFKLNRDGSGIGLHVIRAFGKYTSRDF